MSKQMGTLIITRGLPGSGKTTKAVRYVNEDPENRVHISRDNLRATVFASHDPVLDHKRETDLTALQHHMAEWALRMGKDVVIDDLNLRQKYAREWANLAQRLGARFEVWDMTDVPLEDCIAHDRQRMHIGSGRYVGARVIHEMYSKFLAARGLEPVVADAEVTFPKYVVRADTPLAIVVDIDGTLAHMTGRNPFDYSRVLEDDVDESVANVVSLLHEAGVDVILMSGREETCRDLTTEWLYRHNIPHNALFMRKAGDYRDDTLVKSEMFDENVAKDYDVIAVLDDRDKVVKMWRDKGLKCFQVQPGPF